MTRPLTDEEWQREQDARALGLFEARRQAGNGTGPDWQAEHDLLDGPQAAQDGPEQEGLHVAPPPPEPPPDADAGREQPGARPDLFLTGDVFLNSVTDAPNPLWGDGGEVLGSHGEPIVISGAIGVGKTTVMAGILKCSIGLANSFLGYPVTACAKALYLACDRPAQIARNLRRVIPAADPRVRDRLLVWRGPPPKDVARHPELLLLMAQRAGLGPGDRVFIDGLKDVAVGLSDDEVGAGLNQAMQKLVAADIDVIASHHQRKAALGKTSARPKSLDDVYGSTWITAGAGTVLLVWADRPGQAFLELETLKPAAEHVGPLTVRHDLDSGHMEVVEQVQPEDVLKAAPGWHPIARILAEIGADDEDRNARERVRRRLAGLEARGLVESRSVPNEHGGKPTIHYLWAGR